MDVSAPAVPHTVIPLPAVQPDVVEPPLSPRARRFIIGLRRVALLLADVLGEAADLPKREAGMR